MLMCVKVIAWALTSVAYASVSLDGCPWPPDPPASDPPLCLRYSNGTSIAVNGTRFSPRRDVLWNLTHQHISAVNEFPRSDNNDTLYINLAHNNITRLSGQGPSAATTSLNLSHNPLTVNWLHAPLPVSELDVSYTTPDGLSWFADTAWARYLPQLTNLIFRSNRLVHLSLSSATLPQTVKHLDLRDNPALMVTITDCDTLARVQSSWLTLRLDSMVDANKASVGCTNGTLQSVADAFVCLVATCHPAMASRAPFPVVTPKASPGVVKGIHSTIRAKVQL
ncbi:hypothetical protein, variant [Aphanomyces astaci]|uniref:Leucine-rich repeat-containing N-terminal plant-type domain-containing protein n=1 Tax=Aphanomyces astaci TaxID=112090 RepID=W4GCI8_APHAT|nr:hypothetical protein, variant [Aphanomyces astaci]ETV77402.1 hypothetical protein, variant [Aphanomyces astaci]|eukprot:XP_009833189.1 hypothetical protein, variant [Aphanomyces astaci]